MKTTISKARLAAMVGAIACLAFSAVFAEDSSTGAGTTSQPSVATAPAAVVVAPASSPTTPAVTPTAPAKDAAPARLPYGVEDVLKLSRAQISEDIVLNYIQTSGTVYNLSPKDIVYLRNEGVSDRIVNAMLDQRKKVMDAPAQPVQPAAQPAPPTAYADNSAPAPAPAYTDPNAAPSYAPSYTQAPPAEVQPAPSSVYVIPYPTQYSYYASPYYGGYYPGYYGGYYGPVVSFGFGFGGRGHWGHGGWGGRGGWGHGGGWHHR